MSRQPHAEDLSDAQYITKTLDSARRDLSAQVHISQNASTNLEMEGEMIGDTLHIHKYDLKDSLSTTNSALNILDRLALREKYGLLIAQIFFYLTVAYIILKRIRILTIISFSWNTLYGLNINVTNHKVIDARNSLDAVRNVPIDTLTTPTSEFDRDDISEKLRMKDFKIFVKENGVDTNLDFKVDAETTVYGEGIEGSNSDRNEEDEEEKERSAETLVDLNIDSDATIQEHDNSDIYQKVLEKTLEDGVETDENEQEEVENEEDDGFHEDEDEDEESFLEPELYERELKEETEEEVEDSDGNYDYEQEREGLNQPSLPRSHPLFEAFDTKIHPPQPASDVETEADIPDHSEL